MCDVCVLFSSEMQNSLFTTALTPIPTRSHTRHASQSHANVACHHPRSSTPLRDINTSSRANAKEAAVPKKSTRTDSNARKPDRKRKASADDIATREKVVRRKVNTATAGKNDRQTSSVVSVHSRTRSIDSLAGKRQQQMREVINIYCDICVDIRRKIRLF